MQASVDTPSTAPEDLALEANLEACARSFAVLPGAVVSDDGQVCGARTALAASFFNVIACARWSADEAPRRVDEIVAPYQAQRLPLRWWISPSTTPADLGELLEKHHMKKVRHCPGMALDLAGAALSVPQPSGLRIEPVRTPHQLEHYVATLSEGFGLPPGSAPTWFEAYQRLALGAEATWQLFLGSVDGEPVATAALFVGGGAAGIYHVVTMPQARGRGVGAALTNAALDTARERGERLAVLHASAQGVGVYRGLGFTEQRWIDMYAWEPTSGA